MEASQTIKANQIQASLMKNVVKNSQEFPYQKLKVVRGELPKQIRGTYLRNGIGVMKYGDALISHWFSGSGAILKIVIENGECWGQFKDIQCKLHSERTKNKICNSYSVLRNFISGMFSKEDPYAENIANTSILPLKKSQIALALCEGGYPMKIRISDLIELGFDSYDSIKGGYSAHPKVDPQNGDIYNIGIAPPNLTIMRHSSSMKFIKSRTIPLRCFQSIHDFCLAGDYLIILECPMSFGLWDLFQQPMNFYNKYNSKGSTMVHIVKKDTFEEIKSIEIEPFYTFHFTNGYSTKQQIVFQHIKYDGVQGQNIMGYVREYPKFLIGTGQRFHPISVIEQKRISLQDFSIKTTRQKLINAQFPVCDQILTGKPWRYSYCLAKQQNQNFFFNKIIRYDRVQDQVKENKLGLNCSASEPALITVENNGKRQVKYLLSAIVYEDKSFVEIFQESSLESVCLIELPKVVPNGFHGKWINEIY